jgi:putative adhesin
MSTLSPLRRAILLIGGLLSLGVITLAVLSIVDAMGRTTVHHDSPPLDLAGRPLTIRDNGGDIDLSNSPDGRVHISYDVVYGLRQPTAEVVSTSDSVRLEAHCREWLPFSHCEVNYHVQVPTGVTVDVKSSAGEVTAHDLTGHITLNSSAGDITADRIGGDALTLHSSAGEVVARQLTATSVDASSSAGDVNLNFRAAPAKVTARSSAGDVHLTVPPASTGDDGLYRVEAISSAGEHHVDPILQSGTSARTITATSSAGDVTVSRSPAS